MKDALANLMPIAQIRQGLALLHSQGKMTEIDDSALLQLSKAADILVGPGARFMPTLDLLLKIQEASKGLVQPRTIMQNVTQGGPAFRALSQQGLINVAELFGEFGGPGGGSGGSSGGRVGTGLLAWFNFVVGRQTKAEQEKFRALNLMDQRGQIVQQQLAISDPFTWMETVFKPALAAKIPALRQYAATDFTTPEGQKALQNAAASILGGRGGMNSTAVRVLTTLLSQPQRVQREAALIAQAADPAGAAVTQENTQAIQNLGASIRNLIGVLSGPVWTEANALAKQLQPVLDGWLKFFQGHPDIGAWVGGAFAALTLAGSALLAKIGLAWLTLGARIGSAATMLNIAAANLARASAASVAGGVGGGAATAAEGAVGGGLLARLAAPLLALAAAVFSPGGVIILGLLQVAAIGAYVYYNWSDIKQLFADTWSHWRSINENVDTWITQHVMSVQAAFMNLLNAIQAKLHAIMPWLVGAPSAPAGAPQAKPGFQEVTDVHGHHVGYRQVGPNGLPIGPTLSVGQMNAASAAAAANASAQPPVSHPAITHPLLTSPGGHSPVAPLGLPVNAPIIPPGHPAVHPANTKKGTLVIDPALVSAFTYQRNGAAALASDFNPWPTAPAAAPSAAAPLTAPTFAPHGSAAAGGMTHHGDINITVHQQPGQDGKALAQEIVKEMHLSLLGATGTAHGVYESPFTHHGNQ